MEALRQDVDEEAADIVVARLLDEVAHRHVFDHAPAQRADGLLTHRGAPVLRWRLLNPSILKTGRPACHPVPLTWSLRRCRRLCLRAQRAPAKAGSFCGPERRKTMSARMSATGESSGQVMLALSFVDHDPQPTCRSFG